MTDPGAPVLVSATRTPIGKFGGALARLSALELGASATRAALAPLDGRITPDHTYFGNVVQAGSGQNPARVAAIRGGLPTTVPGTTINDVCLASMTATGMAASAIRAREIDCALVGGFESMSRALHGTQIRAAGKVGNAESIDLLVNDGLWCAVGNSGMGEMSDRVNELLCISRSDQDEFSYQSHRRAASAVESGRFKQEIGSLSEILESDEGVRPDTSLAALTRLKAAFTASGTITAGNASQVSDAAAAGVLTSRARADELSLPALVEIVGRAVVAGPDPTLHLKPAAAATRLLEQHRLGFNDIDVWEINEAFAGVVLATARTLHLDLNKVNVNGGAIALGHPLGASGFRLILTCAYELRHRGAEYGIAAICGGGGQGQAMLLRNVG